jgi:hypothetical protein
MAKNKTTDAVQTIEQLQARFQEFTKQKIVVETDRKHALEKLAELKASAREKYGSDDLEQLQQTLEKMKADNDRKRARYQQDLDNIEQKLAEIEEQYAEKSEID